MTCTVYLPDTDQTVTFSTRRVAVAALRAAWPYAQFTTIRPGYYSCSDYRRQVATIEFQPNIN